MNYVITMKDYGKDGHYTIESSVWQCYFSISEIIRNIVHLQ